jgi:hypothetical protein
VATSFSWGGGLWVGYTVTESCVSLCIFVRRFTDADFGYVGGARIDLYVGKRSMRGAC